MLKVKAALAYLLVVGTGAALFWLADEQEQRALLLPVFGAIAGVGLLLFGVVARAERRPFEKISAGVHEVLGGHLDYEFPTEHSSEAAVTLAQNLNLMMSSMLGRPPPPAAATAGSRVEVGQDLPPSDLLVADASEPAPPGMLGEPAEQYMRRLYDEYKRLSSELGPAPAAMTWVRFVETVVRHERRTKQALKCQGLRFRAELANGRIKLIPMATD